MPAVHLDQNNVKTLAALNGKRTDYADDDCPGLVLRVAPTGSRTFVVVYYFRRKKRRYRLGELRKLSLKDARARARKEVIGPVLQGQDPAGERSRGGLTVGGLADLFMAAAKVRPKTRENWDDILKRALRPAIGDIDARALRRHEVRTWLAPIAKRAPVWSNRCFQYIRRVYNWALEEELLEASPCTRMKKPAPDAENESERVLTRQELRCLLRAIVALAPTRAAYCDALLLLLLTGVRESMVVEMSAEELQIDQPQPTWVIPGGYAGRTKSRRAHVVPLSPQAVAIVRRRRDLVGGTGFLFPRRRRPGKPMMWSVGFVRDLRYAMCVAWAIERGEPLPLTPHGNEDEALVRAMVPRWTVHNLRHTLATRAIEDLGVERNVAAKIIGHAPSGGGAATRVYDRSDLLPARRAALAAWASWLDDIRDEAPARVLPMRSGACAGPTI